MTEKQQDMIKEALMEAEAMRVRQIEALFSEIPEQRETEKAKPSDFFKYLNQSFV